MSDDKPTGPLQGLRVLEIAQLIAGPMAGSFLADLGADVVHLEDPEVGDPIRGSGSSKDGIPLWWKVSARNKRSVAIDLRRHEGQEVARRLAEWADVVITNFRVGTLERWGLDYKSLHGRNPTLIMLQISGFGTNTDRRNDPGFGKVGEAMSGVVNITGFADGPPVHTGFSHADSLTGLMGAMAVQAALYRKAHTVDFDGEWIDLALFETLFRLIEWQVIFYDQLQVSPMRAGNQLANAPAAVVNTYRTADDKWLTVTTGTAKSVMNIAELVGLERSENRTRAMQTENRNLLDRLLREYVGSRTAAEALESMQKAEVVASTIFSMEDIMTDPTYAQRADIINVEDRDLGMVKMQAVIPHFVNDPGRVWRTGPNLGEDTELVCRQWLGMTAEEFARLSHAGAYGERVEDDQESDMRNEVRGRAGPESGSAGDPVRAS